MWISTEVESMFAPYMPLKYMLTRNKNYAFVKCFIRNLMVLILRLKVVPIMLVQSLPLMLAYWTQLVILESSIIISLETGTTA